MPSGSIRLRPCPLPPATEDPAALANFYAGGRTWQASLDPAGNGMVTAVLSAGLAASEGTGSGTAEKGKAKLQVPDKSVYMSGYDRISPYRRELVTNTYTIFRTLQKSLNEPDDTWEDDEARQKALAGHPTAVFCRYYHKYGRNYVYELSNHADRLLTAIRSLPESATEEGSGELDELEREYESAVDMRDSLALMVLTYLPADGEGKAIVAEEVIAWINESNPKPSQSQLDELSSLAVPYEDGGFWPCIYTCALHGRTDLITSLLRPLLAHPNEALRSLLASLSSLLSSTPRSSNFKEEATFLRAVQEFRARAKDLRDTLESVFADVADVQRGAGAIDADTLTDLESGVGLLLDLMRGKSQTVLDAADDWMEALAGWMCWVDPTSIRDSLPDIMDTVLTQHPISPDDSGDGVDVTGELLIPSIHTALLSGDVLKAATLSSRVDSWLAAHMNDLFDKLGLLDRPEAPPPSSSRLLRLQSFSEDEHEMRRKGGDQKLRDFCVLSYGEMLRSDPGLWRLVVEYFVTCSGSEGLGRAKAVLRRVIVDAEQIDDVVPTDAETAVGMDLDVVSAVGGTVKEAAAVKRERNRAGKRPTVREVREICIEYHLEDEAVRLSKIKANQLMRSRKYGAAVSYCVDAGDERLAARLTERLMEEYAAHGPEEFVRLVDEIPASLLDPDAHLFRPELFTNSATAADAAETIIGARVSYSRFGLRLVFLARYRDMHAAYASGDRAHAAVLLVQLLENEVAPRGWWAVLLADACPLLEDDEMLFSSANTLELLRCLEAIVSPILAHPEHRDLHGHLDYLKRMFRRGLIADPPSPKRGDRPQKSAGHSHHRERQEHERNFANEKEETEAVLKQLQVVRHALARHLGRCLAGGL